jgi:hypothetical protein
MFIFCLINIFRHMPHLLRLRLQSAQVELEMEAA